MTAIQFYKFIHDNAVEYHWEENDGKKDVLIFPYHFQLDELVDVIGGMLEEGGIECRLQQDCLAIWASEICGHYGIELSEIFEKP